MPEIKCHQGHAMHVSTDDWIGALTLDQLRYARDKANEKIAAAEAQPKRTVWRVCRGGICEGNYREEEYEKAADHLLRIFKDRFIQEAKDFLEEPYGRARFADEIPRIVPFRVTQHEYDTEWFPQK